MTGNHGPQQRSNDGENRHLKVPASADLAEISRGASFTTDASAGPVSRGAPEGTGESPRPNWLTRIGEQLLAYRILLLIAVHLVIFAVSFDMAFEFRFDFRVPAIERAVYWKAVPWLLAIKLAVFHRFGILHGWWRYFTFADFAALLRVSTLSSLIFTAIDYFLIPDPQVSRLALVFDWAATVALVGGARSMYRLCQEHVLTHWTPTQRGERAVMVGRGQNLDSLTRLIHNSDGLSFRVIGFIDQDRKRHGTRLGGIPFLGSAADVPRLSRKHDFRVVLVVAGSLDATRLRDLMQHCRQDGLTLKMIPPVDRLVSGSLRLQARDVDINDLLGRPPVEIRNEAVRQMVFRRCVMVTGAGGSIGSEICRQLCRLQPSLLLLVERSENNLFHVNRELRSAFPEAEVRACVADAGDQERMQPLFERYRPEIVFHAAAHKHVPLMEDNPGEAITNNSVVTMTLADLAEEHEVERFVLISTDKAVNPTSVMGVSKQLAERYIHALSEIAATKFVAVRFGNVLASAGSVVPIFQEQIGKGGPVTVTHPEMRRYFMTIPEASQLVLQAAAMGRGGEIFVLDMGEPVRILDLAKDLIRLSGFSTDEIPIQITGIRPGEKLYEETYFDEEQTLPTSHPQVRVAYHREFSLSEVRAALIDLQGLAQEEPEVLRARLKELVPEYVPTLGVAASQAASPSASR